MLLSSVRSFNNFSPVINPSKQIQSFRKRISVRIKFYLKWRINKTQSEWEVAVHLSQNAKEIEIL